MSRQHRKLAMGGFFAAGVVLAGTSLAYGCVAVVGQITVTGTNGGQSTSIGNGSHPGGSVFCVPPTTGASAPQATSFANKPTVTVTLGSAADSPCPTRTVNIGGTPTVIPNAFGDSTYDVMFCDGAVFRRTGGTVDLATSKPDRGSCFFTDAVSDRAVLMGTMTVTGGVGSGQFKIPFGAAKNGPNNWAGVSVRETGPGAANPGPAHVNIAAISII